MADPVVPETFLSPGVLQAVSARFRQSLMHTYECAMPVSHAVAGIFEMRVDGSELKFAVVFIVVGSQLRKRKECKR
jgi:hypothetical protein